MSFGSHQIKINSLHSEMATNAPQQILLALCLKPARHLQPDDELSQKVFPAEFFEAGTVMQGRKSDILLSCIGT